MAVADLLLCMRLFPSQAAHSLGLEWVSGVERELARFLADPQVGPGAEGGAHSAKGEGSWVSKEQLCM